MQANNSPLHHLPTLEAWQTLGIHLASDGNEQKQKAVFLPKTIAWADNTRMMQDMHQAKA